MQQPVVSLDERTVVEHFHEAHSRDNTEIYIMLLPMKSDITPLGESRSLAIRFKALEHSLRMKSQLKEFAVALQE